MSEDRDDEAPPLDIPNAGDERGLRRMRDRAKREEAESAAFWKAVFGAPTGRREMWRILELGHAFEERYAADGSDLKTYTLAGEQRLAFRLYRMWRRLDFDGVTQMHRENDPDAGPSAPA